MVNVLVVGSGGREHAIGWKLSQSDNVDRVFHAPGNGGTLNNVQISADNLDELAKFASENRCFTVIGPEAPLAMGIVDMFNEKNLKVFGPTKEAAQLESSKIWAKQFLKRNNIPTAAFEVFDDPVKAKEYVNKIGYNVVIKADGLASGKGVIVCDSKDEAEKSIDMMLVDKKFGDAGNNIIIEERIDGIEASYIALSDGKIAIPMATSQDHKRVFDNDKGPNTGGMGAYSPAPIITEELKKKTIERIIKPTLEAMKKLGCPFTGILYAGLMITNEGPKLIEYNVRFGDPECQVILPRLKTDLLSLIVNCCRNKLSESIVEWNKNYALTIVMASEGYPGSYKKDQLITGIDSAEKNSNTTIFHAGTKKSGNSIMTNGGRVLSVTCFGKTVKEANLNAINAIKLIKWDNSYYRSDIGWRAIERENNE